MHALDKLSVNCPHCTGEIQGAMLAAVGIGLRKLRNTSAESQEAEMLAALEAAGPVGVTTDDFRAAGYYQCNARLWALRHKWGAVISTERYNGIGADLVWHRGMARYRLVSAPLLRPEPQRKGPKSGAGATNAGEAVCK